MLSAQVIFLQYVCPLLGTIIGNCMFAAPAKDLRTSIQRGHLGDLNPTPWAFMLGNCCGWVTYSILRQDLWIFVGNCPGFCLSIWLNLGATKLQYKEQQEKQWQSKLVEYLKKTDDEKDSVVDGYGKEKDAHELALALTTIPSYSAETPAAATLVPHEYLVLFMVIVWTCVISLISFATSFSANVPQLIVGVVVNFNVIFFYLAPLSTIWQVLRSRNSATIHIWTMIANTLNATFWGIYGLATLDPFMYAPNGMGALFGLLQFFLVLTFPRHHNQQPTTDVKVDGNADVKNEGETASVHTQDQTQQPRQTQSGAPTAGEQVDSPSLNEP